MANQTSEDRNSEWVRQSLRTLDDMSTSKPDVDRALVRMRERATEGPRHRRQFALPSLRTAAAVALAVLGAGVMVIGGSSVWAQVQRNSQPSTFEADLVEIRYAEDGSEESTSPRRIRIRADGAHVLTDVQHVLHFLSASRVIWPDGRMEAFLDLLPIPIQLGNGVAPSLLASHNCSLPGDDATVLGMEEIHGYQAVVRRRETVGGHRLTSWRVPELGCETLQVRTEAVQPDGTFRLTAEVRTLAVRR